MIYGQTVTYGSEVGISKEYAKRKKIPWVPIEDPEIIIPMVENFDINKMVTDLENAIKSMSPRKRRKGFDGSTRKLQKQADFLYFILEQHFKHPDNDVLRYQLTATALESGVMSYHRDLAQKKAIMGHWDQKSRAVCVSGILHLADTTDRRVNTLYHLLWSGRGERYSLRQFDPNPYYTKIPPFLQPV